MSLHTSYQDLNLREGASITEIKAAFRQMAKTYHPDAAGQSQADVDKFIKAQSAYQKLLRTAMAHNRAKKAEKAAEKTQPASNWRFIGSREEGLDVYYRLSIVRPAVGGCRIVMPWQAREACPRCLGQGRTLSKVGSLYRPSACSKCHGQGTVVRESSLKIDITAEMVGQGKVRLRKAGLYNAKTAQRGDLILDINWVDHLPSHN